MPDVVIGPRLFINKQTVPNFVNRQTPCITSIGVAVDTGLDGYSDQRVRRYP